MSFPAGTPSVGALAHEVDVEAEGLLDLGVAEVGDEGLSLEGKTLHLVVGVADAALLLGGADEGSYLIGRGGAGTHTRGDGAEGLIVGGVEDIEGRQGQLALKHVVAGGLASVIVIVVKDIIAYLEAESDDVAKAVHLLHVIVAGTGGDGTDARGSREERGCLEADDMVVFLLAEISVLRVEELQELALAELLAEQGDIVDYLDVTAESRTVEGGGEQIVAGEHGSLVAIDGAHRGAPAAHVALINDVVMDERGVVQQLQGKGGAVGSHADFTPLLGHKHQENRAHKLALALGYTLAYAAQQAVSLIHCFIKELGKSLQLGLYRLAYN